jgi:outer membrane protein
MSFGMSLKKILGGAALALALIMPVEAYAQDTPATMKVGVFNADRILAESAQGQQAIALLDQLQNLRVSELQAQQAQLNALQQRVLTAAPDSAALFQREFQDRQIQMQRLQEDVQTELQGRQQELTEPIIGQIAEIIERMGSDEGFTLIFNALQSGMVYVDESVDITDRIIAALNALAGGTPGG